MYNTLEEQVHAYKELARAIQHLEDEKKALGGCEKIPGVNEIKFIQVTE